MPITKILPPGISVSGLDAARQMMRLQKEGDRALNIRPAFMLVPVALETVANQTIKSASVKGADANAGVINPIQNFAEVIAEARLDAADPKTGIWRRHRALTPLKWLGWMVWTRHTLISRKVSPLTALPQKSVLMPEWHHLTGAGWCVRRWPDNRVITITARKGFLCLKNSPTGAVRRNSIMAKNFVQDGTTIELVNAGDQTILSGAAVVVGSMVAVAITDIPAGEAGDGFAEGVFLLPKQSADDIQSGAVVYLKDGVVQLAADGAVAAGVARENAPANSATVAVKINV